MLALQSPVQGARGSEGPRIAICHMLFAVILFVRSREDFALSLLLPLIVLRTYHSSTSLINIKQKPTLEASFVATAIYKHMLFQHTNPLTKKMNLPFLWCSNDC